ncbi:hypothetical protein VPH35_017916 [Triticum aestivum]
MAPTGMEDWISDVGEVKLLEDVKKKMEDVVVEAPDWLPDGWIMMVRRGDDGALYRYFISPVSGAKFTMKSEVLDYLFSEMDEHYIKANYFVADSMLSKSHEWLPKGWLVEIRAGGENVDKMYKILAEVEFHPSELPHGWVKELEYRKTLERTRKDQYYTDPLSHYAFRTLKSALHYVQTGKLTKRAFVQRTSVDELYNFEKSVDLFTQKAYEKVMTNTFQASPTMPRRLKIGENINLNERNFSVYGGNNTSTDLDSPDEDQKIKKKSMKANGKEAYSSKTIRCPTGRPSEVVTQTDEEE